MRGGLLPPALLFVALGLALGFAPRRAWLPSALALLLTLAAFTWTHAPPGLVDVVFAGCWISVIATAACVHLKRGLPLWAAIAFFFSQRRRLGGCRGLRVRIAIGPAEGSAVRVDIRARILTRCSARFNSREGSVKLGNRNSSSGSHASIAPRDSRLPSGSFGVS
jgi:hypothetical protein